MQTAHASVWGRDSCLPLFDRHTSRQVKLGRDPLKGGPFHCGVLSYKVERALAQGQSNLETGHRKGQQERATGAEFCRETMFGVSPFPPL